MHQIAKYLFQFHPTNNELSPKTSLTITGLDWIKSEWFLSIWSIIVWHFYDTLTLEDFKLDYKCSCHLSIINGHRSVILQLWEVNMLVNLNTAEIKNLTWFFLNCSKVLQNMHQIVTYTLQFHPTNEFSPKTNLTISG